MTCRKKTIELKYLAIKTADNVAQYSILEFQKSLTKAGLRSFNNQLFPGIHFVVKCFSRLHMIRNIVKLTNVAFFVPLMNLAEFRTFPLSYIFEIIPYCYDCWPYMYDRWEAFFRRHRIRIVFFTALQSADYFQKKIPSMESFWVPEACDPDNYLNAKSLRVRSIDILELGRRNDAYHDKILTYESKKYIHLFEAKKGEIIFPTKREFFEGLENSKIVICFPCSMTHTWRSGNVETVTHKYFQSIASKCLVLGHCPSELKKVFGYSPVVEVDYDNPSVQIRNILSTIETFQPFVENNYKRLLEVGTWDSRVDQIISILRTRNYLAI